jgi:hypothetical protein
MAAGVLLVTASALGVYGYYRGALRLLLALLPLILASFLLWLFGSLLYRIDMLRNLGLAWPAFILLLVGLVGGHALRSLAIKKLAKRIHRADRVGGVAFGVLLSVVVVWIGCMLVATWVTSRQGEKAEGSAVRMARALDNTVLGWIPVVGSGSSAMMGLLEISMAEEEVRQRAIQELGLDHLMDVPEMRAVVDDPQIRRDVDSAGKGNVAALWRLQKDPKILDLFESREVLKVLEGHAIDDIAEAVRRSQGKTP